MNEDDIKKSNLKLFKLLEIKFVFNLSSKQKKKACKIRIILIYIL